MTKKIIVSVLVAMLMLSSVFATVESKGLSNGTVSIYDYGNMRLHVFDTGDVMLDSAFLLESDTGLVGIELPSFDKDLQAWMGYIASLDKPFNNIFISAHPAGGSYVEGKCIIGTERAKDAIESGSTKATTEGLLAAYGNDFRGDEFAVINTVTNGYDKVDGIDFITVDAGDTYDIIIPAINAVYMHMLGKYTHSIVPSIKDAVDMITLLESYKDADYTLFLSSHAGVEGRDAVVEKISYLKRLIVIADESRTSDEFIFAMKEAFPSYDGENYLEMTADSLFH